MMGNITRRHLLIKKERKHMKKHLKYFKPIIWSNCNQKVIERSYSGYESKGQITSSKIRECHWCGW